jgi:hypothetical protein
MHAQGFQDPNKIQFWQNANKFTHVTNIKGNNEWVSIFPSVYVDSCIHYEGSCLQSSRSSATFLGGSILHFFVYCPQGGVPLLGR